MSGRCFSTDDGPLRLGLLGHTKDSLWSIDLFRCESILLKNHWMLVIMDQFTRRIIGFGVHAGDVDGEHQPLPAKPGNYSRISHCNGLFQTPVAA